MDNDLQPGADSTQVQLARLQNELAALKKMLGLDPAVPVHELPQGARLRPTCDALFFAAPGKPASGSIDVDERGPSLSFRDAGGAECVFLHVDQNGGQLCLRDHAESNRVCTGATSHGGSLAIKAPDGGNRVELFVKDDGGQVCVRATNEKPRASMKALADGGVLSVVDDTGQPQTAMFGRETGGEFIVLDQKKEICARIISLPEGALISAQRQGRPVASMAAMNDGGMIMLHDANGQLAVSLGDSGKGGHVRVHDTEGTGRAALMVVDDMAWVTVSNKDGRDVCSMNNLNEAGYLEVSNRAGEPTITLDGDKDPKLVVRDGEKRIGVLIGSDEQGGMIAVHDNAGQLAALMDVDGNMDKPVGRIGVAAPGAELRSVLSVDREGQGIVHVFGSGGEQRAAIFGQKEGGTFHSFGAENIPLAVLGGTQHGGSLTVNNDLGICRAALSVHKDGGQVQLHWAGLPVATLSAQEHSGMLYLFDNEGDLKTRLPEDAPPEDS